MPNNQGSKPIMYQPQFMPNYNPNEPHNKRQDKDNVIKVSIENLNPDQSKKGFYGKAWSEKDWDHPDWRMPDWVGVKTHF